MEPNPLLAQLGYPRDARLVIFHADDVGMSFGSNRAFVDLSRVGLLKSGSVMVPCPWAPAALRQAATDATLDLGVHLTLTSEWADYRWGPISTRATECGLLDDDGCFWRSVPELTAHLNADAAKQEMRAQIQRAVDAGVNISHIDTHMGTALAPELLEEYIALGFEFGVPVFLSRGMGQWARAQGHTAAADKLDRILPDVEAAGMPLMDEFRGTPMYAGVEGGPNAEVYEEILRTLPPGTVTYFSLHPNAPGDIEQIAPAHAPWRHFEYTYFQSDRLRTFLADQGIVSIGCRDLRSAMEAKLT